MTDSVEVEHFRDAIRCPVNIFKVLSDSSPYTNILGNVELASLFECTEITLAFRLRVRSNQRTSHGRISMPYSTISYEIFRVERFQLLHYPEALSLFDTVFAASKEGPAAAGLILGMLSKSLRLYE